MDRRYRLFLYFLGILVVGSVLMEWLSGSIRVSAPPPAVQEARVPLPLTESTAATSGPQSPPDAGAEYKPPYAPSYVNPSLSEEESSSVREAPPSEQPSAPGIASSSDLQPPAPPPTASSETPASPDRNGTTTSPKSSNAAFREILKQKGR